MLRTFVRKNIGVLTGKDINNIRELLNELSAWPWTPKFVTEISKAVDLEFAARSPEVVAKLCDWLVAIYQKMDEVTFAFEIPTCSKCRFWEQNLEIASSDVKFGHCHETTNIGLYARPGSTLWVTPANFGCVNGEPKDSED